ncbi:MAG: two-component sensor histidine kinase [Planctomycetaceae bacterium]|nr:two-component sensor histidine kinase [Planctomycetaceae bacterium]
MKRLFIRFYAGVLAILVAAWFIQAFVFSRAFREAGKPFEDVFAGGLRSARALLESSPEPRAAALKTLQAKFDFPVAIVPTTDLPEAARERYQVAGGVAMYAADGLNFAISLSDPSSSLKIGPIPGPRGPSQTDLLLSMGALLVLVAGAIAFLLAPISRQLRRLEATAAALANGDFSARVDIRKAPSLRTLAGVLNHMASRIESLLNNQRDMLHAVSHELRTPLSRIGFAIDLLRSEAGEEQREDRLTAVEQAALEMDLLVAELLRFAKWEAAPPESRDEDVDVASLVEAALESQAPLHPAIELSVGECPAPDAVSLRGDRVAIERVLGNLLANAGRFAAHRVIVECRVTAAGLIVDVDDDGPGIAPGDRQRVLEPFVRLGDSGRGAGLGLALVRRIVVHHGGQIEILDSQLGGCRARVRWPACRVHTALPAANSGASADTH